MMKRFSERYGLNKSRAEIQLKSMDSALRNRLWNLLCAFYWSKEDYAIYAKPSDEMAGFLWELWNEFFKLPVDSIPVYWWEIHRKIRKLYFSLEWYKVYDFIEFMANNFPNPELNEKFMKACNVVLEEELSGYRFIGGKITPITAKEEISEIEEALESPIDTVRTHLETALERMSDRQSPDYRNSIKESISAVEALCKIIANDEKANLGKALDIIEEKIGLHKALKKAFDSLYGYTSSAEGIRHALLDEPSLTFEDAKFMLVSCSAFINYLISKASKAGLI